VMEERLSIRVADRESATFVRASSHADLRRRGRNFTLETYAPAALPSVRCRT
jgi:hypothetical protein